jgi:hypothetical protein
MGARIYLQVTNLRHSPRIYSSPVIAKMKQFKPFTQLLYADKLIYVLLRQACVIPALDTNGVFSRRRGSDAQKRCLAVLSKNFSNSETF